MFNPSDVYVSGGSNELLVCWTDKVTKHDASSFYNFEQDNLPLHDLDERTHLLWEKLGHPTSALTGFSFIVSADATDACKPLYFTTLSSCVAALPEVINYPILIEIASFGNLGGLDLSNKSFGPSGSLEIINRNSSYQGGYDASGTHKGSLLFSEGNDYGLASGYTPKGDSVNITLAIGADGNASGVPSLATDAWRSRLFTKDESGNEIFISSGTQASGFTDERFTNPYVYTRRINGSRNVRMTASLSSTADPFTRAGYTEDGFSSVNIRFDAFDLVPSAFDASTINEVDGTEIKWGNTAVTNNRRDAAVGICYFNKLDYVKVNNCRGPIFLRNLNVDGQHATDRGIEVKNSTVNLERCAIARCNEAGLYADNSEVTILRGMVAYRNYQEVASTRQGQDFSVKQKAYGIQDVYGAGIYALNSTIDFDSAYERSLQFNKDAYDAPYNATIKANSNASGIVANPVGEELSCFSRNDIGIHLVNSKMTGGTAQNDFTQAGQTTDGKEADTGSLFCELNTEAGIKMENSVLDYSGKLLVDGNYFGIDSSNSELNIDKCAIRFSQSTGLNLNLSKFLYNKDLYGGVIGNDSLIKEYQQGQLSLIFNGQGIKSNNSRIMPLMTSSMPELYNAISLSGTHGVQDSDTSQLKPTIEAINGSDLDLVHVYAVEQVQPTTPAATFGRVIRATDNSKVTIRGSGNASGITGIANTIFGPDTRTKQINMAGLYANKNSTLNIQGPTVIAQFGVDAYAEDNSNIRITPHQNEKGDLLVSSFLLEENDNHTMVELHSTRACLVADNNSNILMENLGDYQSYWNGAYASTVDASYDFEDSDLKTYTSAGFIEFYPNGDAVTGTVIANTPVNNNSLYNFQTDTGAAGFRFLKPAANNADTITTGGMCVRALGNSTVNAHNVHFPARYEGYHSSGYAYDIDGSNPLGGPNCTRLFIWNIAGDSTLEASYLSVSGNHPRDTSSHYFGPSGVWGNYDTGAIISGAPTTLPDTSSLSILDYYGARPDSTEFPFGKTDAENIGPFRLFFSVDPASKFLVGTVPGYTTSNLSGVAYQLFSQGYPFLGNLSAVSGQDFEPSAQYTSLLKRDGAETVSIGFYEVSSMMVNPTTTKAFLDDSALNTFANAKHNMVGKSTLAKVVEGYYPIKGFGGDSDDAGQSKGLNSVNNFDLRKNN